MREHDGEFDPPRLPDYDAPVDVVPLLDFFASVRKQSAEAFKKRHPEPVFVFTPVAQMSGPDKHFITTQVTSIAEMRRTQGTEAGKKGMEQRVALVKKTNRNPFTAQIYVGRASNNDVVIEDPNVSKSHAFLEQNSGHWFVTDMGSVNGTWLDAAKIETATPRELRDGGRLRLGTLELQFFLPETFHRYIAEMLAGTPG